MEPNEGERLCTRDEIPKYVDIQNSRQHILVNSWPFFMLTDWAPFISFSMESYSERIGAIYRGGLTEKKC